MEDQFGKLTTIISTVRHGEKDDTGKLTELGEKQALETGLGIEHLKGDIVLLHSGVARVRKTLTTMALALQQLEYSEQSGDANRLGTFKDYTSHYLHYLYDPDNKGELFSHWDDINGDLEAEFVRMQKFLEQADVSSEPEVYPSPREMAKRLARVIATEIDFATITIPEVRTNFINGSHEPVIMAFLYYFLQDFNPLSSFDFLKELTGTLGFAEGFEIKVFQNLIGKNTVMFKFRNKTLELDQNKLKDFCISN